MWGLGSGRGQGDGVRLCFHHVEQPVLLCPWSYPACLPLCVRGCCGLEQCLPVMRTEMTHRAILTHLMEVRVHAWMLFGHVVVGWSPV